jgi:hypothetical protein
MNIYRETPDWDGIRTAVLGYTADAGALREAMAQLKAEGFEAVIGPMEGSTWGAHRLVTESDGRPAFLMEPVNPAGVLEAYEAAGLEIVSRYVSAVRPVDIPPSGTPPARGVRLRAIDLSRAEEELAAIHALSLEAFAGNRYYAPISREAFIGGYRPVLPMVDSELVLLAEDDSGMLRGFLFAIPDYNQGRQPNTVILKTYASRMKGVGSMLANAFHARAKDKGFGEVIHALMHEDNLSTRHSDNTGGRVFRRYALWGARL